MKDKWRNLSLLEEENKEINVVIRILREKSKKDDSSLIGLHYERNINKEVLSSTI